MFKTNISSSAAIIFLTSAMACNSYEGELDGTWVSSKNRTMEEISNSMNLSNRHQSIVENLVGKMKHTIKGASWMSEYDGILTESEFIMLSKEDNCYELMFDKIKQTRACLYDNELHLPSGIDNVLEIFIKQ